MCDQRRHRNRGQWHVCQWCGDEFEGAPVYKGLCSEDCCEQQEEHRRTIEDLAAIELELWEQEEAPPL